MQISSFVGSSWLTENQTQFVKTNPFTGEALHNISSCDLMGLVQSINAANKAFAEWNQSQVADRVQLIEKFKTYLIQNKNKIAISEAEDQACPYGLS
jgi:acyl-CoA reductase-like NAD-dependent aldehyde dehydrogenase